MSEVKIKRLGKGIESINTIFDVEPKEYKGDYAANCQSSLKFDWENGKNQIEIYLAAFEEKYLLDFLTERKQKRLEEKEANK